ncbi:MAG TPA: YXWGXW repeat-containing protein [Bryobacteraceae bacterium]|nr:YXWGXW repeat-containing protein [Bryobacteraceae bacterium]
MLAGAFAASGQIGIGIRIGPPPAPRVVAVRPVSPGVGYTWVDGYWYPVNNRYVWHRGYWSRPPYEGAVWVGPHHDGDRFFGGYWQGDKGRIEHDHRWDRDRDRDYRHEH